ncbi:MAG TPA: glucose-6-phosphate dehydrogenase [Phycisphaerae bacterium]|nr:glucose-6-phosphate dehydrogenase [Phycisphaerae bacterium]
MEPRIRIDPTALVIFGAAGDLTRRKLVPALYNLYLDHWLPEQFAIVGLDRKPLGDDAFRTQLRDGATRFSRRPPTSADWDAFARRVSYLQVDFVAADSYTRLAANLAGLEKNWAGEPSHIYYLATPPAMIGVIPERLAAAQLTAHPTRTRLVVEKPFGHDLASATELNRVLARVLAESQIYRIDHYLGKETVQNILAFRFANSLFEPIWNQRYIDHVQITVAEQLGVEHRGAYYEEAGALRDMVQNHLLQILCHLAMEAPVSFAADEIRNKKTDVLHAIRPIPPDQVTQFAVRGQYDAGLIQGRAVPAYRREPNVSPASPTETFIALKLFVDNWRWQDVPFYLRTGKRLPQRVSEACIQFRPVPHRSFPAAAGESFQPNRLIIRIAPEETIRLRFQTKTPGAALHLSPVDMHFSYSEFFRSAPPQAYETLLLDVMLGDATLFMREDQVAAAWSVVQPILDGWSTLPAPDFPNYPAGTWGPEAADALLASDGRHWIPPAPPITADPLPSPIGNEPPPQPSDE